MSKQERLVNAPVERLAPSSDAGALQRNVPMEREMKIYPVDEEQLESLGFWNASSVTFFAVGGIALGVAIDLILAVVTETDLSDKTEGAIALGIPSTIIFAALAFGAGGWVQWRRYAQIGRIKRNARPVRQSFDVGLRVDERVVPAGPIAGAASQPTLNIPADQPERLVLICPM